MNKKYVYSYKLFIFHHGFSNQVNCEFMQQRRWGKLSDFNTFMLEKTMLSSVLILCYRFKGNRCEWYISNDGARETLNRKIRNLFNASSEVEPSRSARIRGLKYKRFAPKNSRIFIEHDCNPPNHHANIESIEPFHAQ